MRQFRFLLAVGILINAAAFATTPTVPSCSTPHENGLAVVLPFGFPLGYTPADSLPSEKGHEEPKKEKTGKKKIYTFNMLEEIGPSTWRQTQEAFKAAEDMDADIIIIHMNTYGGAVDAADKIRTKILTSKIPVYVFVDDNAASAGALISIACDSIYMTSGATIGSATVVDGTGKPAPEKYQSYMRSRLRSTAQQTGRNPLIAEGMNDSSTFIPGIKEKGKVLAFTTTEAMLHGYCNGKTETMSELLRMCGFTDYEITEYQPTVIGKIIDFLINPFISGLLIMIIIGGIYFELKSPGVGFPLFAAITAAVLYFAPLYLQGLADNWEILVFLLGVILLAVEIFVIPGFGVTGISGIILIITGLTLALIDARPTDNIIDLPDGENFIRALFIVVISIIAATVSSFYFGGKLLDTSAFSRLTVAGVQKSSEGYIVVDSRFESLVGAKGMAHTVLRPSGKVSINGESFDATTVEGSFIDKGEEVEVVKHSTTSLFVRKVNS
jgi:membrane-bound serine protease (ClpP class)